MSSSPQTPLPSQGRGRGWDSLTRSRVQVYALVAIYCSDVHSLPAISEFTGYSQVEVYYALRKLEALRMLVQISEDSWAIHPALGSDSIRSQLAGLRLPARRPPKPQLAPIQVQTLSPLVASIYLEFDESAAASGDLDPIHLSDAEIEVFRILKRTAAVYLLLLRLNRPAGESEIARILQVNRRTVRSHLRALEEAGLVARTHFHAGWTLTRSGRHILGSSSPSPQSGVKVPIRPLHGPDSEPNPEYGASAMRHVHVSSSPSPQSGVNDPIQPLPGPGSEPDPEYDASAMRHVHVSSSPSPQPGKNIPIQPLPGPDSEPDPEYDPSAMRHVYVSSSPSPQPGKNIPVLPLPGPDSEPNPEYDTPIWQALLAAGLTPNMRTRRLVRMPYLTPEYICAHHLALLALDADYNPARLLTVLESAAPAPEISDHSHIASCNCEACRRDR